MSEMSDSDVKALRQKWARKAKENYQAMTPEQRAQWNLNKRLRQYKELKDEDPEHADELIERERAVKSFRERQRYNALSEEKKKAHNQKRCERHRLKRAQELQLLNKTVAQSSAQDFEEFEKLIDRRAKKAAYNRKRYHTMNPIERKAMNKRKTELKKEKANKVTIVLIDSDGDESNDLKNAPGDRVLEKPSASTEIIVIN